MLAHQIPNFGAGFMSLQNADDLFVRIPFALHLETSLESIYREISQRSWLPWRGKGQEDSDFLAVLDVRPARDRYGKVLATVPVGEKSLWPHNAT
jgi:hypothetical protein